MIRPLTALLLCCLLHTPAQAQTTPQTTAEVAPQVQTLEAAAETTPARKPVIVSGTVPDEATRQSILAKVRELYGNEIVDQLGVGAVATPPNWSAYVNKLLTPDIKQVSSGQLSIDGNNVSLRGNVGNEALRKQLVNDMANRLNPSWQIKNGLRVAAGDQQLLDQTLANRIIEFDTGSMRILPAGTAILDEMAAALLKMGGRNIEIIGHTDSSGNAAANQALSEGRAAAVRQYLIQKGIEPNSMHARGEGALHPVASNTTAEGRARNRRIEFRAK